MPTTYIPVTVVCQATSLAVPGELIAPGLAITPAVIDGVTVPDRYALTHVPSGQRITPWRATCRTHLQQARRIAIESGVAWDANADTVRADPRAHGAYRKIFATGCGPCDDCPTG
jgi:hypothetical protein